MSTGAREQVGRLLALVPLIQRRGEMRLDEAAAALGMEEDQLVKDLRVLMFCGWPGWLPGDLIEVDLDALDGERMIRIHNAEYLNAPLRLSPAEASAVIVALRILRESGDGAVLDSLDGALAKLEAVADEGQAPAPVDVHVDARERQLTALRTELSRAVDQQRQVHLTYYVPARDENTERTVDPIALVESEGTSYLQAWCRVADNKRLFRLDRVVDAQVLDQPADPHPDVASPDLGEALFRPGAESPLVQLRLAPPARWVAEYYPVEDSREAPDGALDIDLRVADPRWLQRLLLRLSPHVEVLAPAEAARAYADAAAEALALYRPGSA